MGVTDGDLLKIGQVVAKQLALAWLAEKKSAARRGLDLSKLIRARFPVRRAERAVLDSLVRIEDDVADRLAPGLAGAAHGLPGHEREAAYAAVSDALEHADLSDTALFVTDLDPAVLAGEVRRQWPVDRIGLSDRAVGLYDTALDRACVVLVHLVRELPEFDAAVAVEHLARLHTVLDGMSDLLDRVPVRGPDAPAGTDFDEQFRRRYLDAVRRTYDRLEVIGLTTHSYEPRTTLSVAYLSLTVTSDVARPPKPSDRIMGLDWLHEGVGKPSSENLRVESALGDSTRIVVRGEAGAGKSTLLRWLAVNAARSAFTDKLAEWNDCVPFLVKLRDFADRPLPRGDELLSQPSSPHAGPVPPEWAHRRLDSGKALLLVDGVDELVAQRRQLVRHWLTGLLAGYPSLRVVVTSRPTAVGSKWLAGEGFRSVVLEPMTPADVQVFLRRWHDALLDSTPDPALLPCRPEEIGEHQRALLAQLQARAHLRALARSPLLCAMLCALNLDRRARLPRDRVALYQAALDMLLERRDADRNVAAGSEIQASTGEKLVLLRVLAWWLNENGRTEMSRDQALARLRDRLRGMPNVRESAEVLLDHLVERSGVIRQPAQGRIDFIHRTFQEFLAAQEAVDRDSIDLLVSRARSDLWRETVLMACAQGSAEQRGRLLDGILNEAGGSGPRVARQLNLLAAACKETATLAPPDVLARIDERVMSLVPPRSVRESRSLATIGEPVMDYLPDTLDVLSAAKAAACVRTIALVNGPQALNKLTHYARDPRADVQQELISAWKYFDPEAYATRVLADAPLFRAGDRRYVKVDFRAALPHLHLLRNLRTCWLALWDHGQISDEVRLISKLHRIESLILFADFAPDTLSALGELAQLNYLFVNFGQGWPTSLPFISELTELRHLSLFDSSEVTDFRFLQDLAKLSRLNLYHNRVNDWIDHVGYPDKILTITTAGVEEPMMLREVLERFPRLRTLCLRGRIGALDPLRRSRIEYLEFGNIEDLDLKSLCGVPNLRRLRIIGSRRKIDLTPLVDQAIEITLDKGTTAIGADKLGPGVTLRWR